jgi:hypothetical protein
VFHLFIYPEELTETVRNLNHDTWCPGQDSNRTPPKYLSRVIPLCQPAPLRAVGTERSLFL